MDLFWAATLTFLGAMFMVILESMEQNVKRIKRQDEVKDDEPHWSDAVVNLSDVVQVAARSNAIPG
jgi:hypothetical protein